MSLSRCLASPKSIATCRAELGIQCADWIEEDFIKPGKVRHLGFSTHGRTSTIVGAINTNKFSFVNLHKHYFGSYTDLDNMPAVEAACANDMGVFIISPTVSLALPRKIVCAARDLISALGSRTWPRCGLNPGVCGAGQGREAAGADPGGAGGHGAPAPDALERPLPPHESPR